MLAALGAQGGILVAIADMYRSYTESAGKYCRQLGLISVALIWLFHNKTIGSGEPLLTNLNCFLKVAFLFTLLSLIIDLVQEAIGSFLWHIEFKDESNKGKSAEDCTTPINFANGCIVLKLITMCISYAFLATFFFKTPIF